MIGTAISLIGGGLLYLYPESRWLGWSTVIAGGSIAIMATIWALAYGHARRKFQAQISGSSPAPSLAAARQETHQTVNTPITLHLNPNHPQPPTKEIVPAPEYDDPQVQLLHEYIADVARPLGRYIQVGSDFRGVTCKAVCLDFDLRQIRNSVPWLEVRAQIIFNNNLNQRMHVIQGIWQSGECREAFHPGETKTLTVATYTSSEGFKTYEYVPLENAREREIKQLTTRVQVRLIGEYMSKLRFNEFWCFELSYASLAPTIRRITPEEFEAIPQS